MYSVHYEYNLTIYFMHITEAEHVLLSLLILYSICILSVAEGQFIVIKGSA